MVRLNLGNIPEELNKFKREKPYSEIVTDYWIEESDFNEKSYNFIIQTEEEPNLKINTKYEDWIELDGEKVPKSSSSFYKFLKSLFEKEFEVDIDVPMKEIQFYPDIRGKKLAFEVEHKSFTSKTEMDEDGQLKVISFDVWTVAAVGNGQMTIPTAEPTKQAPKAEPETPIDEEEIKVGYLKILKGFEYESFTLANIIGATNKFFTTNPGTPNSDEYKNASKRMGYLSSLVNDGYITKGEDGKYKFCEGMIEAIGE